MIIKKKNMMYIFFFLNRVIICDLENYSIIKKIEKIKVFHIKFDEQNQILTIIYSNDNHMTMRDLSTSYEKIEITNNDRAYQISEYFSQKTVLEMQFYDI